MIPLDLHRYDAIKQKYFDKVYGSLQDIPDYSTYHVSHDNLFIRELVYTLYKCDLINCLVDKNNDIFKLRSKQAKDVNGFSDDMLKAAVRALVLADVPVLRKTTETFDSGTAYDELCKYHRLKNKSEAKKTPLEKASELQLKDKYGFLIYFAAKSYEKMRRQEIDPGNGVLTELPKCIVNALGIRTCPYCNRGYIGVSKGRLLGVQLDHFYNRNKYPFLAVSLYNLVPCCGVCNLIKRDIVKDIISPYEDDADFENAVHFTYEIPKSAAAGPNGGKRQLDIVVDLNADQKQRYENNIEIFRLKDAYAFQELEAERFYEKMIAYPESRLQEIAKHFNDNSEESITAADLEESLFREYFTEPSDYTQKPMAKFYRDLYYNIKGWKK